MGNCLKTQLKGSVNNENLPHFQKIVLHYSVPDNVGTRSAKQISFQGADRSDNEHTLVIECTKGHMYSDSALTTEVAKVTQINSYITIYIPSDEECEIAVYNKYYGIYDFFNNSDVAFEVIPEDLYSQYNLQYLTLGKLVPTRNITIEELVVNDVGKERTSGWSLDINVTNIDKVFFKNNIFKNKHAYIFTENNVVYIYGNRSGQHQAYTYSNLLGTYNKTTKVWSYE